MTNANSVEDRIAVALLDGELELHQIGKAVPAVAGQQLQGALRVLDERGIVDVRRNDERKIVYFLTDGGETYAEAVKEGRIPIDPPRAWERRRGNGKAATAAPAPAAPPAGRYPPPVKRTAAEKANAQRMNAQMAVAAERGSIRPNAPRAATVTDEARAMKDREDRRKADQKPVTLDGVVANEQARKASTPITRENVVEKIAEVGLVYDEASGKALPAGDLSDATKAAFLGPPTPPNTPGQVYQVELPPGAIIGGPGMHVLQGYVPARACITAELTEGNGLRMQSSVPSHYPPVVCIELDSDAALALYTLLHAHLGPKE